METQQMRSTVLLASPDAIKDFGEGDQVQIYSRMAREYRCYEINKLFIRNDVLIFTTRWTAIRRSVSRGLPPFSWEREPVKRLVVYDAALLEFVSEEDGAAYFFDPDSGHFVALIRKSHETFLPARAIVAKPKSRLVHSGH